MPGRIVSLFRNLLRKNAVEQSLDDELRSSVELLTEQKMKEGSSAAEARWLLECDSFAFALRTTIWR